jgi:hypothetical protein
LRDGPVKTEDTLGAEDLDRDILAVSQPGHVAPPRMELLFRQVDRPTHQRQNESEIGEVPGQACEIGKLGGEEPRRMRFSIL